MTTHTPGPWRVIEREIPWSTESGREGAHVERWIYTDWEHPQLKDLAPVVTLSTGIAKAGDPPVRMVSIREHDARLIASAPELLGQHEAHLVDLELLLRAIKEGDPKSELEIRVQDIIRNKGAVIAKATGADP